MDERGQRSRIDFKGEPGNDICSRSDPNAIVSLSLLFRGDRLRLTIRAANDVDSRHNLAQPLYHHEPCEALVRADMPAALPLCSSSYMFAMISSSDDAMRSDSMITDHSGVLVAARRQFSPLKMSGCTVPWYWQALKCSTSQSAAPVRFWFRRLLQSWSERHVNIRQHFYTSWARRSFFPSRTCPCYVLIARQGITYGLELPELPCASPDPGYIPSILSAVIEVLESRPGLASHTTSTSNLICVLQHPN